MMEYHTNEPGGSESDIVYPKRIQVGVDAAELLGIWAFLSESRAEEDKFLHALLNSQVDERLHLGKRVGVSDWPKQVYVLDVRRRIERVGES